MPGRTTRSTSPSRSRRSGRATGRARSLPGAKARPNCYGLPDELRQPGQPAPGHHLRRRHEPPGRRLGRQRPAVGLRPAAASRSPTPARGWPAPPRSSRSPPCSRGTAPGALGHHHPARRADAARIGGEPAMKTTSSLAKLIAFAVATLLATGTLAATIANVQFGDKATYKASSRTSPVSPPGRRCASPGSGGRDREGLGAPRPHERRGRVHGGQDERPDPGHGRHREVPQPRGGALPRPHPGCRRLGGARGRRDDRPRTPSLRSTSRCCSTASSRCSPRCRRRTSTSSRRRSSPCCRGGWQHQLPAGQDCLADVHARRPRRRHRPHHRQPQRGARRRRARRRAEEPHRPGCSASSPASPRIARRSGPP